MQHTAPVIENADAADDTRALSDAIAESDADPRTAPHKQVREWLMRLACGEFDAPPPEAT